MKEALVAFTVLDKWGLKLEDQEKQWKKEAILYVHWQTFFLFPSFLLFSHRLSQQAQNYDSWRSLRFPLATVELQIFHPYGTKGPNIFIVLNSTI